MKLVLSILFKSLNIGRFQTYENAIPRPHHMLKSHAVSQLLLTINIESIFVNMIHESQVSQIKFTKKVLLTYIYNDYLKRPNSMSVSFTTPDGSTYCLLM